jgi:hypothetical protein
MFLSTVSSVTYSFYYYKFFGSRVYIILCYGNCIQCLMFSLLVSYSKFTALQSEKSLQSDAEEVARNN